MTRSFALILVVLPLQEQFSYDVNQNLREHLFTAWGTGGFGAGEPATAGGPGGEAR